MKYLDFKKLPETQFKRYTGISWSTFDLIVEYMKKQIPTKGRPTKLGIEDQVLLCLSYWREYRTLFHVATSYGVSSRRLPELYVMLKIAWFSPDYLIYQKNYLMVKV